MWRITIVAVILLLTLVRSAWSESGEGSTKQESRAPLPHARQVKWDVQVFEDSPAFKVVKRQVKGNQVTWVLENKRALGTEIVFGYQAALYDGDGVKLATIGIEIEPSLMNLPKGERNRFILHLPPADKLNELRKVVIKNGN